MHLGGVTAPTLLDNHCCSGCFVVAGTDRRHRRLNDSRAACYCGDSVDLQPGQRSPDTELTRARNHFIVGSIIE
jgi:hypothetical protein